VNQAIGTYAVNCETARALTQTCSDGCVATKRNTWDAAKCVDAAGADVVAADATACTTAGNQWVAAGQGFCVGTDCTYTPSAFNCYTLLTTPSAAVSMGGGGAVSDCRRRKNVTEPDSESVNPVYGVAWPRVAAK
jgi:hypothetical protein